MSPISTAQSCSAGAPPHVRALLWNSAASLERHRRGPLESQVERFLVRIPRPAQPLEIPAPITSNVAAFLVMTAPDPEAIAIARRTLTVILEVWAQRRPISHLGGLLDPSADRYTRLIADRLRAQNLRAARLASMRICQPHPDAAEIAAVCVLGRRPRAVAARFERATNQSAWRCRAIQIG